MAKQDIKIGTTVNDGTGDNLRVGAQKINANFGELYTTHDKTLISGSSQIEFTEINNVPTTIVSGSSQVSFNGIADKPTLISGSDQISGSFINRSGDVMDGGLTTPNISSSYIDLTPLPTDSKPSYKEGRLFYNTDDGALSLYNDEFGITLQIGQEFYIKVMNRTGGDILDGKPVFISGSQGDKPLVHIAASELIDSAHNGNHIIGVATHAILDNGVGYVTTQGLVHDVDTSDFNAGDILYLSSSAGEFTNILPEFPYEKIQVATVMRKHTNGIIYVRPLEPIHMSDISGLSGSNGENGDIWVYNGSNGAWYPTRKGLNLSGTFSGSFIIEPDVPTSTSGSGTSGEIRTDENYIYVCTATNTWKRSPLTTW